jgi:radical SAM-linked protein
LRKGSRSVIRPISIRSGQSSARSAAPVCRSPTHRDTTPDLASISGLEQNLDPGEILASLQAASPPGISFISARRIGGKEPSLQSQIRSAEYEVRSDVLAEQTDIQERVLKTLDADQLPSERRGKAYDLRPLIEELQLVEDREGHPILRMRLSAREGATGRPDEVCHQLDLDVFRSRIHRTRLIL